MSPERDPGFVRRKCRLSLADAGAWVVMCRHVIRARIRTTLHRIRSITGSTARSLRSMSTPPDPSLPAKIGKPALRALTAAGITRLSQIAARSDAELLALHGVGPKAVRVLRATLAAMEGEESAERP